MEYDIPNLIIEKCAKKDFESWAPGSNRKWDTYDDEEYKERLKAAVRQILETFLEEVNDGL